MKKYLVTSSLIAIFSVIPSLSSATPTDRQIVASKAYVDTKQNKIPVQTMTIGTGNTAFTAPLSLVSYPTTTDGAIGQLAVLDQNAVNNYATANNINTNGLYEMRDILINIMWNVMPDSVPNSSLVGTLFELSKIPASGQYDLSGTNPYTTGDSTTNTDWLNAGVKGTGVATRTGTNGVIGERKIFEASDVANYHAVGIGHTAQDIQDISIPTVGAVMAAISSRAPTGTANTIANYDANGALGTGIATLSWTSTETTATRGYSTAFDNTASNWPTADANKLVNGTALANGLALKQNIIPVQTMTIGTGNTAFTAPLSLVSYPTTTDGAIGQLAVLDDSAIGNYATVNNINVNSMNAPERLEFLIGIMQKKMPGSVPTSNVVADLFGGIGGVIEEIIATLSWTSTETTATRGYSTAFDNTASNWPTADANKLVNGTALANGLALKQNIIPVQTMTIGTGNTAFTAPLSLVSYPTTTDGAIGQLAVLDDSAIDNYATVNNINVNSMNSPERLELLIDIIRKEMPGSVPTSNVVADLVESFGENLNVKIPASGQYDLSGTNPYTNGNGTTNTDWLNANVKGTGVATRTGTNGVIGERKIFESTDVANYHATGLTQNQKDIQDISIPTVGAVMTAISSHVPTGTANNVAMYDANGALGDGHPTADVADYNETTGELENGADIATIAAVETKQDKMVCAGYAPDHLNDPDYCWLWRVAE